MAGAGLLERGRPAPLRARDQFIGWTPEPCRRRRALIANNARLLVLPECPCPNLISRFMKLMLQRLCADWEQRWGIRWRSSRPSSIPSYPKAPRTRSAAGVTSDARPAARLETRVRRKGQWQRETVYLISSRSLAELEVRGVLRLKRKYWVIESRLHPGLDLTLQEDLSRVRRPNSVRVLGMVRRLIVSRSNAAVNRARKTHPKTKHNTKSFRKRLLSARGGRERRHAMIFAKCPQLLDL